ncbi:MAG: BrnT family toxin [Chitinispirillaceae bacterium]|nr:BrnT family toxin [Chitinispirillaceae bacterium]
MNNEPIFEWNPEKNKNNLTKHGVSFYTAQYAFRDPRRIIALDRKHSTRKEKRYFCYGRIEGNVITVRFTWREGTIRIFGAGYWRSGRSFYNEKNKIY